MNISYHVYNSNSVQQIQIFILCISYDKYGSLIVHVAQHILLYASMGVSGGGACDFAPPPLRDKVKYEFFSIEL